MPVEIENINGDVDRLTDRPTNRAKIEQSAFSKVRKQRKSRYLQYKHNTKNKPAIQYTNTQYINTNQNSLTIYCIYSKQPYNIFYIYRLQSYNKRQGNYVKNPITQERIFAKLNEEDEILLRSYPIQEALTCSMFSCPNFD